MAEENKFTELKSTLIKARSDEAEPRKELGVALGSAPAFREEIFKREHGTYRGMPRPQPFGRFTKSEARGVAS